MTSEKGKLKKLYIEALMIQGDPRSYNEIKADLELMLWNQRFNGIHEVGSALEDAIADIGEPNTEA